MLHPTSLMLTSYLTTVHLSKSGNQQWYSTINFSTDLIWILPTATLMSFFWSTVKFRIQHCIYLSCLLSHILSMTVHQSFCVFMTLTLLKTTGQLFCSISLNLGWSGVFPWLDWGYAFLENTTSVMLCPSQFIIIRRHMMLVSAITGDVNLGLLGGICCVSPP